MDTYLAQVHCEEAYGWEPEEEDFEEGLASIRMASPSERDLAKIENRSRKIQNRKPKFKIQEVD